MGIWSSTGQGCSNNKVRASCSPWRLLPTLFASITLPSYSSAHLHLHLQLHLPVHGWPPHTPDTCTTSANYLLNVVAGAERPSISTQRRCRHFELLLTLPGHLALSTFSSTVTSTAKHSPQHSTLLRYCRVLEHRHSSCGASSSSALPAHLQEICSPSGERSWSRLFF